MFTNDLETESEWDLTDIPPSGEIDVCSRLQAKFTVIRDNCNEYLVETPAPVGGVFQMALSDLNALGEQRELLEGVEWLYSSIQLSE